jgi:pimeloyl-ACP methyl ester carboxylesterase
MRFLLRLDTIKTRKAQKNAGRIYKSMSRDKANNKENDNSLLKGVFWGAAAVGAAAVTNAIIFYKTPPLTSILPGAAKYWSTPDGDIFYKKHGEGSPVILVHGIGAGCSSFEWRQVMADLAQTHTVYALDLLGFGKSDKPNISYTAERYIELITQFAEEVVGVGGGRGEADIIASSLSAAYVIAASQRDETLFRRLVLVCPTGLETLAKDPHPAQSAAQIPLKAPVLGTSFYNMLTSKPSLKQFLNGMVYANPKNVTDAIINQYHISAHQPGAEHAIFAFVSGQLNCDVTETFPKVVDMPLVVWGDKATTPPLVDAARFVELNINARLVVIEDTGILPHEEAPEEFLEEVRPFLAG